MRESFSGVGTVVWSCQAMGLVAINYLGFQRMRQAHLPWLDVAHSSIDVSTPATKEPQ